MLSKEAKIFLILLVAGFLMGTPRLQARKNLAMWVQADLAYGGHRSELADRLAQAGAIREGGPTTIHEPWEGTRGVVLPLNLELTYYMRGRGRPGISLGASFAERRSVERLRYLTYSLEPGPAQNKVDLNPYSLRDSETYIAYRRRLSRAGRRAPWYSRILSGARVGIRLGFRQHRERIAFLETSQGLTINDSANIDNRFAIGGNTWVASARNTFLGLEIRQRLSSSLDLLIDGSIAPRSQSQGNMSYSFSSLGFINRANPALILQAGTAAYSLSIRRLSVAGEYKLGRKWRNAVMRFGVSRETRNATYPDYIPFYVTLSGTSASVRENLSDLLWTRSAFEAEKTSTDGLIFAGISYRVF